MKHHCEKNYGTYQLFENEFGFVANKKKYLVKAKKIKYWISSLQIIYKSPIFSAVYSLFIHDS